MSDQTDEERNREIGEFEREFQRNHEEFLQSTRRHRPQPPKPRHRNMKQDDEAERTRKELLRENVALQQHAQDMQEKFLAQIRLYEDLLQERVEWAKKIEKLEETNKLLLEKIAQLQERELIAQGGTMRRYHNPYHINC